MTTINSTIAEGKGNNENDKFMIALLTHSLLRGPFFPIHTLGKPLLAFLFEFLREFYGTILV